MRLEPTMAERGGGINWGITLFMLGMHLAAVVAAVFYFSWGALATTVFLMWVGGSLGIGMGYHRLLTHRGYKVPKAVEHFLTTCGSLALEGGPIAWVATHRVHHAYAERDGDPHSPRHGVWWSHMGWLLTGRSLHHNTGVTSRYCPDLAKDPFHVWLTHWHFLPNVVIGIALFLIGGLPYVLWGICLRICVSWHVTWFVNSASHIWGRRRFETRDDSRNNWWVALLSFGEGWHNNHHAHPAAARHGLAWYELDVNWLGIRALKALGIAKDIRLVALDGSLIDDESEPAIETAA
jgi:fatty-acid desaturase